MRWAPGSPHVEHRRGYTASNSSGWRLFQKMYPASRSESPSDSISLLEPQSGTHILIVLAGKKQNKSSLALSQSDRGVARNTFCRARNPSSPSEVSNALTSKSCHPITCLRSDRSDAALLEVKQSTLRHAIYPSLYPVLKSPRSSTCTRRPVPPSELNVQSMRGKFGFRCLKPRESALQAPDLSVFSSKL